MFHEATNEGAGLTGKFGIDIPEITAGTTYDNAPYTTEEIDRDGYQSSQVQISYEASLAATKTLSLKLDIMDCATSGGTFSTASSLLAATVVETGSGTPKDVYNVNIDLSGYERYVKLVLTPDLSNSGTDTVKLAVTPVLSGKRVI